MKDEQKPVGVELQEPRADIAVDEEEGYRGSAKAEPPLLPSKEFSRFLWQARAALAISFLYVAAKTASYLNRGDRFGAVIFGSCSVVLVVTSVLMRNIHRDNDEELKSMKQINDRTS